MAHLFRDRPLPEFVHSSNCRIKDPTVRLIEFEQLLPVRSEAPVLFEGYSSGPSEVDRIVQQILRRTFAHKELDRFINGSEDVFLITPVDFEKFLDALYRRQGFRTTLTKASRDGGFDVIASSDLSSKEGLLIQAKKTSGRVGV